MGISKSAYYYKPKDRPVSVNLKVEEVYMFEYENFSDVASRVTYFIEEVYNKKRLHSSLGYMPPEEFEYIFKNNKIRTHQLALT